MYTNPRFEPILAYLKEHRRASVQELSALLYVSEATMRRDLGDMQQLGLLSRTHGGAVYVEAAQEVNISVRQTVNALDKELTAAVALHHLPDGETIFVDNSSTCLALVRRMDLRRKRVVTNSFMIANALAEKEDVRIIMPGGEIHKNADLAGSMACNALRNFRFDLMLCSCAALDDTGAYENSLEVRELKTTAMELSRQRILLADRTKLRAKAVYRVSALCGYQAIYTNAPQEVIAPLREAGVPIYNR